MKTAREFKHQIMSELSTDIVEKNAKTYIAGIEPPEEYRLLIENAYISGAFQTLNEIYLIDISDES